ncbi:MAG: 2-amino-4-hydroxy-6-hydroxymethyldihydropteridine diphosphokinase [Deltaproteobacteria bacterium]|nr:2-amino-4-hydroxy-6-hydroxymethyldihydropteridine diphosphokinase [Deltaproteobacteria bacterium]
MSHVAYIGVGSNLGDRAENCMKGIEAIDRSQGCCVEKRSPLYETEPVGYEEQGWFVNGVVKLSTDLEPVILLERLRSIERELGRKPTGIPFGPRVLDFDILLFEDIIIKTEKLTVPHPELHKRRFVLKPLADIAPDIVHPVLKERIITLLENLKDDGKSVVPYSCD